MRKPAARIPPRLRPLKRPQQQRSLDTMEVILQAAAELLENHGYTRLTTNHVARRAGVSIGSLYQYFPNKEAICHALAQRHFQRHAERYIAALRANAALTPEQQIRAVLRLTLDLARQDPALAKDLYAELARIGGLDPLRAMREAIEAELTRIYADLPPGLRPRDPQMVAFIVNVAGGALIGDAVLRQPQWLGDERFFEQLCELFLGYYQRLGWLTQS